MLKSNNRNLLSFKNYLSTLKNTINNIDMNVLLSINFFLEERIKYKNNIFVAGNGGSASIANHLLCDFNKGTKLNNFHRIKPRVISLSNSIEIITAISNDLNYKNIFSFQLENLYNANDCLICFSSSGQSNNIIDVMQFAKKNKIKTILFQGFGKLNKKIKPDFHINLNCYNYGITEDVFSVIMHMMSQFISHRSKRK
jgi:D-sedoheptulose 7-phosphate isomerase